MKQISFDEFFLSGMEESISPFLTDNSKKWIKNLGLKISIFSAILFIFSLIFFNINNILSYFLISLIYFSVGIPALLSTIENLKKLDININVLMTLAAIIAILLKRPFEGALLIVLFGISNALEKTLSYKTKSAIHHLNKISPTKAYIIQNLTDKILSEKIEEETILNFSIHEKSIKEVSIGDYIFIKAGEIIPLDGVVIGGISSITLEHLTGETTPIFTKKNDLIPAGSRNLDGILIIKVLKTSYDSTLNQIIKLISSAQKAKPKIEKLFDKITKKYASSIIIFAFLFSIIIPILFSIPYFGMNGSIYRALTFLIAASPCALIIAIPAAYLSTLSSCTKRGVILKGGVIFDTLYNCKIIAFDKTGTLTKASFECTNIDKIGKEKHPDIKEAIAIATTLEKGSTHPLAKALLNLKKKEKNFLKIFIKNFKSIPGYGITADVKIKNSYQKVFLGLSEYIEKKLSNDQKEDLKKIKEAAYKKAQTISVLYVDKQLFVFRFSDSIRTNAKKIISTLKKQNKLEVIMITGDNKNSADFVANTLQIEKVFSNLKPKDKLDIVEKLSKDKNLAMVGDGINDAPSLARSNIGISLGKIGSKTAVDASDIILVKDDLSSLPWLFKKAKKLRSVVIQNLIVALFIILFASSFALFGLIPLYLAVLLHEGGTLIVGLNSLRLLKK
ncbi:MAG: hypothetical protein AMS24_01710 [Chlamydiae bacterium SM23_39]|nr:MAG: hypothetical protein AMS24_01710 [Chlamydiae bacterium SM23_39]